MGGGAAAHPLTQSRARARGFIFRQRWDMPFWGRSIARVLIQKYTKGNSMVKCLCGDRDPMLQQGGPPEKTTTRARYGDSIYIERGGHPHVYIEGDPPPLYIYRGGPPPRDVYIERGAPPAIYRKGGHPRDVYIERAPPRIYRKGAPPRDVYIERGTPPPAIYRKGAPPGEPHGWGVAGAASGRYTRSVYAP